MRARFYVYLVLLLIVSNQMSGQGFLSTNGKAIIDESGDSVILRGMGLGGWMLQEGYMMHTSGFANAQFQLQAKIEELIGAADTDLFYETWQNNHVKKAVKLAPEGW